MEFSSASALAANQPDKRPFTKHTLLCTFLRLRSLLESPATLVLHFIRSYAVRLPALEPSNTDHLTASFVASKYTILIFPAGHFLSSLKIIWRLNSQRREQYTVVGFSSTIVAGILNNICNGVSFDFPSCMSMLTIVVPLRVLQVKFYRDFGRPIGKVFLISVFTYQVSYYAWSKLDMLEEKRIKTSKILN